MHQYHLTKKGIRAWEQEDLEFWFGEDEVELSDLGRLITNTDSYYFRISTGEVISWELYRTSVDSYWSKLKQPIHLWITKPLYDDLIYDMFKETAKFPTEIEIKKPVYS